MVMNTAAFYDVLAREGLAFGPAFRALQSLRVGPHEALGHVMLADGVINHGESWTLHPALLDACFHVIGARLDAERASDAPSIVYLPIGIDRVTVLRDAPPKLFCVAALRDADASGAGVRLADLRLETADGTLIAQIDGLRLRRVTSDALQRAVSGGEIRQVEASVRWTPVAPETQGARLPTGRVLIIPDGGGVAAALNVALTVAGVDSALLPTSTELSSAPDALSAALSAAKPAWLIDCSALDAVSDEWMDAARSAYAHLLRVGQVLLDHPGTGLATLTRGAHAVTPAVTPATAPALALAPVLGLARTIATERQHALSLRLDLGHETASDVEVTVRSLALSERHPELAWRDGTLYAPRLDALTAAVPASSTRRTLVIRERGTLEQLTLTAAPREQSGPGAVEIEVRASGLNFRDVLNTLGMYPGDAGPLGSECSGVVTAVGDGVTGFAIGDEVISFATASFATHVIADTGLTIRKPASISFEQAAALPNAYVTAAYAVREVGRIQPGQRVLVHAALGGVGLAALRLARAAGAEVIATAGSDAKRARALEEGALHAFDSRSTTFADDVMRVTHGRGVDLVVNSLAGDFIDAGMRVVAPGGCFVELGKNGIWSAEQAAAGYPAVRYAVVDIGEEIQRDITAVRAVFAGLVDEVASGILAPLPTELYALDDAVSAFRHMAMARHMGKVVLTPAPAESAHTLRVRSDATYLITGGLGGLGLAVASWLVARGASTLVLLGRHGPGADATEALSQLRAGGARVDVCMVDVSDREAVRALWRDVLPVLPPLRGIVHAAGRTADAGLPAQNMERYDQVAAAKIHGTWNLHDAAADDPLDFFALFSSSSALFGAAGQAPYAAANAFLDAFASWRRARGEVATSFGWGAWGQAGMASTVPAATRRRWAANGIGMLDTDAALDAMARTMFDHGAAVQIVAMDRSRVLATAGVSTRALLGASDAPRDASATVAHSVVAELRAANTADRPSMLRAHIRTQVCAVLGLETGSEPDDTQGLSELGMDSLMATELRTRLQRTLSLPLPATLAFEHPSIGALTVYLLSALGLSALAAPAVATPVDTLSDVSDDDIARLLDEELDRAGF